MASNGQSENNGQHGSREPDGRKSNAREPNGRESNDKIREQLDRTLGAWIRRLTGAGGSATSEVYVTPESRKALMRRLMTLTLSVAWLPLFAVFYGVLYQTFFLPFKTGEFAAPFLIAVIGISLIPTFWVISKVWKYLQSLITAEEA